MSRPFTEEEIRAYTIGELKPLTGRIQIVEYDPRWPELFEAEAERIRTALRSRRSESAEPRIQHAGSTSVAGLAAKPVIDMVLAVADSGDEDAYRPALESAGYVLRVREPEWYQHRMFKGPGGTEINLHVFSEGCEEIDRMLMFRDWLRGNLADRVLYEQTKRALAEREWKFMQNYADAKRAMIDEILERAKRGGEPGD